MDEWARWVVVRDIRGDQNSRMYVRYAAKVGSDVCTKLC